MKPNVVPPFLRNLNLQVQTYRANEALIASKGTSKERDRENFEEERLFFEEARQLSLASRPSPRDTSDRVLVLASESVSHLALHSYLPYLHLVPRVVNVVTLAEAVPAEGCGFALPLDLRRIAARCRNAFFAPRRFSAVQIAFKQPRCRVLIFHTGRVVGTGCGGRMAARVALQRAQRQLARDADLHIHLRNFAVINVVGAVSLRANVQCEEFAKAHSATAHYDARSFVGLAWRPANEAICCEIYSTGKANLPGSKYEHALQDSWSRMLPEILRFSSAAALRARTDPAIRDAHLPRSEPGIDPSKSDAGSASLPLLPPLRKCLRGKSGGGGGASPAPLADLADLADLALPVPRRSAAGARSRTRAPTRGKAAMEEEQRLFLECGYSAVADTQSGSENGEDAMPRTERSDDDDERGEDVDDPWGEWGFG